MVSRRIAWATFSAVLVATIGWAAAHSIDLGCADDLRPGCQVPDGGGLYFAVLLVSPVLLAFTFLIGTYKTEDWRPMLGFSAGAVVGGGVAFSVGTSVGYRILVLVLVAIGAVAPWGAWRLRARIS
ncbi:hypothetical protein [Phytohabitans aurantiacus]|uniref:Integral membrane protein n=1 Tax=Phytohabitans aurantiacus TaxID=3016789 RepID=A0ABQ5RBL6_9ACTN|nr:hypothetical protein [Phytohabitans aurantiacus]GLI03577.1 hypothetical protein Pa4123_88550 [Phytohabitans aurantiacus]